MTKKDKKEYLEQLVANQGYQRELVLPRCYPLLLQIARTFLRLRLRTTKKIRKT